MATTLVRTIQVTNISQQLVVVHVVRKSDSQIFDRFGNISITPSTSIEAEDDRFQLAQLRSMQNNKVITFTKLTQLVTIQQPILTILEFTSAQALKSDGSVWTWGSNSLGSNGDNSVANRSSPVSVVGNHSFEHIGEFTYRNKFAIKEDGSAWGWGNGNFGRLGTNSAISRSSPVSVVGNHSFILINPYNPHALKADGSMWCWGYGGYGGNGDNTTTNRSSPISVIGDHSFIDASGYGLALKADGSAWGWGNNAHGKLGDNSSTFRSSPVSVIGGHSFVKVCDSIEFGTGIKADGTVWCWGRNQYGQLGQNDMISRSSPVSVIGGHSFVEFTIGIVWYAVGRKSDGSLWSWGYNLFGQLGDGTASNRSSPVRVIGGLFTKLGNNGRIAQKNNGSLWSWGFNGVGNVGDGTTTSRSSPVKVIGLTAF